MTKSSNNRGNAMLTAARGERARRTRQSTFNRVGADSTVIRGNCIGVLDTSDTNGQVSNTRTYIPGFTSGLSGSVPQQLAAFYSEGKFLPGTTAKWVPNVGFTTTGRITVAFTTSPEVMAYYGTLGTFAARESFLRGVGNAVNFPVYEERTIAVPTTLRRKLFDTNSSVTPGVDVFDRSAQIIMMWTINGAPISTTMGSWEYHDHMHVTGLINSGAT